MGAGRRRIVGDASFSLNGSGWFPGVVRCPGGRGLPARKIGELCTKILGGGGAPDKLEGLGGLMNWMSSLLPVPLGTLPGFGRVRLHAGSRLMGPLYGGHDFPGGPLPASQTRGGYFGRGTSEKASDSHWGPQPHGSQGGPYPLLPSHSHFAPGVVGACGVEARAWWAHFSGVEGG